MRIVLFHPRGYDNSVTKTSIARHAVNLPPVGLASIAAVLRKDGHNVTLFDAGLHYKVPNSIWAEKIISCRPDFVGFSTVTSEFHDAYDVCCRVKNACRNIKTIFGGVHVSWGKDKIITGFPSIDYVISGEGEYSFLNLVNGKTPEDIEGLYYREGNTGKNGPARKTLCSMDDLPFPAYDMIEGFPKRYQMPLFSYPKRPGANIISSRGCIYRCRYCDRSVFKQSFRWNSPEYTMELIKWLYNDFGIRHIMFYDDLFTLDKNRVARLCELIRNSRLSLSFNCIVRIGHIDNDLISVLKSAGCWMVNVGIESGDQEILNGYKDGLSLEKIKGDIEKIHKAGIWVKGLFMMGFPGETEDSIKKTIEFAKSLPLKDANITAFTPFPGSPVAKDIDSLGILENDWSKMDCMNFVFIPKGITSRKVLEKYYRLFIKEFYNRPFMRNIYRKMIVQSPHSYWRLIKGAVPFLSYAKSINE